MITVFKHRVNERNSLANLDQNWGVEIDLRSDLNQPGELHLSHDPFNRGEPFSAWLKEFKNIGINGPIILNTKEDGLESLIMELLRQHNVSNYIFLDTTVPTLKKWTRDYSNPNFFVRWSSLEPIEYAMIHAGFCSWVWVDCFNLVAPPMEVLEKLRKRFKVCMVSPELQGGSEADAIEFAKQFKSQIDGACSKFPEVWR